MENVHYSNFKMAIVGSRTQIVYYHEVFRDLYLVHCFKVYEYTHLLGYFIATVSACV